MRDNQYQERVLQFGGGNFLRAFSNWMLDILNKRTDFNGSAIIVKPTPKGDYTDLRNQDGQYHIITKGIVDGNLISDIHQVTSISRVIHPYKEWQEYLKTAEQEKLRFVISNTTESGIRYIKEEWNLDRCPIEFPAKLTVWLYKRWQYFEGAPDKGGIILPCELIEDNAQKLKECILKHITNWDLGSEFQQWILNSNYFCNTLVDRIVPGKPVGPQENESLEKDDLLVMTEPYHLWAIEAPDFVKEELPFQETDFNVIFTDDLTPYRKLKVRILNGAHTGMVPVGYLHGLSTVREALEDEKVGMHISDLLYKEIMPTLEFPKSEVEAYIETTLDRFRNPYIDHQLLSISLNSISKFRYRLLPSLLLYVDMFNEIPNRTSTSLASLIIFYLGKNKGESIPRRDDASILEYFDSLRLDWEDNQQMASVISSILGRIDFWGQDLNKVDGLKYVLIDKVSNQIDY